MNEFLQNMPLYQIFIILLIVAILSHIITGIVLKKIIHHTSISKNKLDDCLIKAISAPLKVMTWYIWIYIGVFLLKEQINILMHITKYVNVFPILIIAWGIIRVISNIEDYISKNSKNINKDSIKLFSRLVRILLIVIVTLVVAQFFGFSISSILTFGGVGGIVIGFAAKDMLSNIFGGFMIQLDKPFSTGDWIRITGMGLEGVVEKIGWRMTRIRTFSKNPIYVPNSIFTTVPIETPSRMTSRRIKEIIGVRYNDIKKIPNILKDTKKMLAKHTHRDLSQPVFVYFDYFNSSSLDINIQIHTNAIEKEIFQQVKEDILLNVANIIAKYKAEIAYPTQTLNIHTTNE